jgi:hypothetical protein
MEEVFKRWSDVKNHPQGIYTLEKHKGFDIFNYVLSEYFKQGEENETGLTKLYCSDLYKKLGMTEFDIYNPQFDIDEGYFDHNVIIVLEMLNDCNVLFLLSEPSISKPYYTIALTPVIDNLIYFDYKITYEYE